MEAWIANPQLMEADADAEYAEVIEIDLADISEPCACVPNDPDDALSAVQRCWREDRRSVHRFVHDQHRHPRCR